MAMVTMVAMTVRQCHIAELPVLRA